jgi:hypothetical protein
MASLNSKADAFRDDIPFIGNAMKNLIAVSSSLASVSNNSFHFHPRNSLLTSACFDMLHRCNEILLRKWLKCTVVDLQYFF